MTETVLASLAMQIDARSSETATEQLLRLTKAAADVDAAFGRAGRSISSSSAQSERSMRGLAQVYGNALNAQSQYGHSVETTTALILQNARSTDAMLKQQEQAARAVQRLTSSYDPLAGEVMKVNNELVRNQRLFDQGRQSAEQYAATASGLTQKLNSLHTAQATGVKSSAALGRATLDLGRQFTDIGVSLAGGQSFAMVMIQQLPQIADGLAVAKQQGVSFKDALGGLAGGARALFSPGGLIAIGVLGLTGLAAAFLKGQQEAARFQNTLTITGNYAGLTADKFEDMARRISDANDTSFADTKKLIGQAAASGKLSGDTLELAVQNAQAFSRFTGESASKYLAEYEKMKGGVAKFGAEHALVYHDLTLQQIKQIELLEKSGKAREAEQRLMENIAATVKQRAEPAYGYLEQATRSVTKAAKEMWDAILGIGRPKTPQTQLEEAQRALRDLTAPGTRTQDTLKRDPKGNYYYGEREAEQARSAIAAATARVTRLQGEIAAADKKAKADAKKGQDEADKISGWLDSRSKSGSRDMTDERQAQLDAALATAKAAELQARQAMTKGIEARAAIERDIVKAELDAKDAEIAKTIAGIADDKGLSASRKELLTKGWEQVRQAEQRVADQKIIGINQQQFADQIARQRAVEDTIAGYTDRQAQSQAALATSLEQAQAIENKALADRQQLAADRRDFDLFMEWADGKKTAAEVQQIQAGAAIADAADREVKARNDRLAIFQRDLDVAQAASANEVDILNSRKGLAQSSYEASRIERQILDKTFATERDRLTAIIANKDTDAKTLAASQDRLATIEEIHANELRQLELSDNAVTAYADLVGALSNAARAVVDGDIGGSISAAGGVLRQLSGLAGSGSALGQSLATAASYAGPIGAAISAVTGVLGAIGDRSAAKAQAKLDALNKSVEALRADNKASSGSIAGALADANASWNADLEYSSAMVTSLRSIDNQIGALANALSRQITAGGLLSTSTLGLGTTSRGPDTGTVLASGLIAKILPGLFGSKTKTELLDQGLAFNPTTYGQGITGSTYADIASTTTKKFLGQTYSTKVSNSTVSGGIDPSLLGQINGIVDALGKGVLAAASVFGAEAAKAAETALGSAVVDLGKLSLKDLKPDEIAAVLQATFDRVGDQLAAAGIPGLDKLATVGEGSFETLTRLAREYQVVDTSLAALGKTFGQVGLESLAARDNLVQLFGGLDAFTSATSFFATNFLTDAEQLAPVIKAVNDNLKAYGLSAESSRDTFKALVLAQDLTTEAGRNTYAALLAVAPAFDKVADAAEKASASRRELEIQLLDAMGKTDEAAKARLEIERQGVDESLRYLFDQIQAEKALTAAREAASVAAVADAEAAAKMQDLWSKSTAAAIETATQAAERQAEASKTLGDGFAGLINKFYELSKSLNEFADSLGVGELSGLSGNDAYRATRSRLMGASGEQTQDAIRAFLAASREVSATDQAYRLDVAFAESIARQRAIEASGSAVGIAELFSRAMASQAAGFATGGSFEVGGSGPADSKLFSLALSPGEMVNVQRPGSANDNSEMAALRQEVRELRQVIANGLVKVADNVNETNDFLRNGTVTTVGV